jgi:hypothetical protein
MPLVLGIWASTIVSPYFPTLGYFLTQCWDRAPGSPMDSEIHTTFRGRHQESYPVSMFVITLRYIRTQAFTKVGRECRRNVCFLPNGYQWWRLRRVIPGCFYGTFCTYSSSLLVSLITWHRIRVALFRQVLSLESRSIMILSYKRLDVHRTRTLWPVCELSHGTCLRLRSTKLLIMIHTMPWTPISRALMVFS